MSSSFPDPPSPRDPRREEAYTPTPSPPAQAREEDDEETAPPRPKLGSLAQKARGGKLRQSRIILFLIGGLSLIVNIADLVIALGANADPLFAIAIDGLFIVVSALFIVFGALIYLYPVPITIVSLVLYVFISLIDLALKAMVAPALMLSGLIWKIVFTIALASSPSPWLRQSEPPWLTRESAMQRKNTVIGE